MDTCTEKRSQQGYSLMEMLIVTSMIMILSTIPIALLRRSREKIYEAQAVRALNVVALAYENYYAQAGLEYPNFRSDKKIVDGIRFTSAEAIWDNLTVRSLLPREYSGYPHNQRNLLAKGYVFSIYPADLGTIPGIGYKNSYALAMVPYKGSPAKRGIATVQGQRYYSVYPTALPRKMKGMHLYSTMIYTLPD
jgi:type II secretory pathway pseudopilin PulG